MHCNISSVVEFLAWGIKISFMNAPKEFFCILKNDITWSPQKLGMNSKYEVPSPHLPINTEVLTKKLILKILKTFDI